VWWCWCWCDVCVWVFEPTEWYVGETFVAGTPNSRDSPVWLARFNSLLFHSLMRDILKLIHLFRMSALPPESLRLSRQSILGTSLQHNDPKNTALEQTVSQRYNVFDDMREPLVRAYLR
jgi:hypothetical protein